MTKKEIKQMQRSILYRKLTRLTRLYGQNATEMILGAILLPPAFIGLFIVAGSI